MTHGSAARRLRLLLATCLARPACAQYFLPPTKSVLPVKFEGDAFLTPVVPPVPQPPFSSKAYPDTHAFVFKDRVKDRFGLQTLGPIREARELVPTGEAQALGSAAAANAKAMAGIPATVFEAVTKQAAADGYERGYNEGYKDVGKRGLAQGTTFRRGAGTVLSTTVVSRGPRALTPPADSTLPTAAGPLSSGEALPSSEGGASSTNATEPAMPTPPGRPSLALLSTQPEAARGRDEQPHQPAPPQQGPLIFGLPVSRAPAPPDTRPHVAKAPGRPDEALLEERHLTLGANVFNF